MTLPYWVSMYPYSGSPTKINQLYLSHWRAIYFPLLKTIDAGITSLITGPPGSYPHVRWETPQRHARCHVYSLNRLTRGACEPAYLACVPLLRMAIPHSPTRCGPSAPECNIPTMHSQRRVNGRCELRRERGRIIGHPTHLRSPLLSRWLMTHRWIGLLNHWFV